MRRSFLCLVGTFSMDTAGSRSTVISGGSFVVCLLVFMGASSSSLVAYIPIVLGTAAIGSVIVQLLYLPLKKVLNR